VCKNVAVRAIDSSLACPVIQRSWSTPLHCFGGTITACNPILPQWQDRACARCPSLPVFARRPVTFMYSKNSRDCFLLKKKVAADITLCSRTLEIRGVRPDFAGNRDVIQTTGEGYALCIGRTTRRFHIPFCKCNSAQKIQHDTDIRVITNNNNN
jgi:hypothetical protein